ncbi:M57 family metalloprotease, partial [Gynurincola endophyticus]|uniref:M57 family metalloprotease n=1 Tax=Gynurincola endophyticus TaxID=2479004 RepID=UPI000F8EC8D6
EGDLFISNDHLLQAENYAIQSLNSNEEHYRHVNLVTGLPRVISIRVNASLPASYITATNAAIARYNALGLSLTFTRVTTGGSIVINGVTGTSYLSMSGFPTGGNPYGSIDLNRSYLDTWASNTVVSVITHAIGHCIGFHHTDYYSATACNMDIVSGPSGIPVIIPGIPSSVPSWMNSCISNGMNIPFSVDDVLALNYVY